MTVYTLFGQAGGGTLAGDSSDESLGMQFTLSQNAALTGIWFYSVSGATALPDACCIYQVTGTGTGTQVTGTVNNAPSWSGAAGSGWVKCTYNGSVTLTASTNYKVTVHKDNTTNVYSGTANYWSSGTGGSGLTSGIITAPNNAGADGGQDTFTTGGTSLVYPASSFNANNYWVDVEVTTTSGTTANAGLATGTGTARPPVPAITAPAGLATGTGTAPQPSVTASGTTTVTAGLAAATGAVPGQVLDENGQPVLGENGTAILDEGALNVTIIPAAAAAAGSGAALQPAIQTSGSSTANAQLATGTGTAQPPAPAVTAPAGLAAGTGTAQAGQRIIPAGLATATAAAQAPALTTLARAQAATALAAALNGTVPAQVLYGTATPGGTTLDTTTASGTTLAAATPGGAP